MSNLKKELLKDKTKTVKTILTAVRLPVPIRNELEAIAAKTKEPLSKVIVKAIEMSLRLK